MIKKILTALFLLGFGFQNLTAQTYVLNEDFSTCTGTTPPSQWQNYSATSILTDLWQFDNPGNQSIGFPFSGNFAIFDSPAASNNFQPEESILESAIFDATNGNFVYLLFDSYFTGFNGDSGWVEIYDGTSWQTVKQYTSFMSGVVSEMIDVTSGLANVPNAKIRFRWKGNGLNYWALDNISVFIPVNTDVGILSLASPQMPFDAAILDVKINVKNFGGQEVSAFTLNWMTNGILQTPVQWNGSLSFSEQLLNLQVGGYSFNPGKPVHFKIWVTLSTPLVDLNSSNDTLNITVTPSFCGTYTVGGINPDFLNFTQLAGYLNDAGVACPTTFLVRDGTYTEQFELYDIPGSSSSNTICFRGENLIASTATLTLGYSALNFLVSLNHSSWISFEYLNFERTSAGGFAFYISNSSSHISFFKCRVEAWYGIYFTTGSDFLLDEMLFDGSNSYFSVAISAGSSSTQTVTNLTISNSSFTGTDAKAINISYINDFEILNNDFEDYTGASILVANSTHGQINSNTIDDGDTPIEIKGSAFVDVLMNTITGFTYPAVTSSSGNSAITIGENKISGSLASTSILLSNTTDCIVRNNFVQVSNSGDASGITISGGVNLCKILFNSIRMDSQGQYAAAISINSQASQLYILSNIFANLGTGYALSSATIDFTADYNNYYSFGDHHFMIQNQELDSLSDWQSLYSGDTHSISECPFYSSATNLTCNQSLINNAALATPDVINDIDGTSRSTPPDIGAREFSLCALDVGINSFVGLAHNMAPGLQNVTVELHNHGTVTVNSCTIRWKKNGTLQPNYSWSGALLPGESVLMTIGSFTVAMAQSYDLDVWTLNPNGGVDCKSQNDLLKFLDITSVLCGTYTIGGTNPDFTSFSQAVQILNLAGISCPVLFLVRNGTYYEQFTIESIQGADSVNTVTFRGENLDSSQVKIYSGTSGSNFTVKLENTAWIKFEHLSIVRNSNVINNQSVLIANSSHISFKSAKIFGLTGLNCLNVSFLSVDKTRFAEGSLSFMATAIKAIGSLTPICSNLSITNSVFENQYMTGISIVLMDQVSILNNLFYDIELGISLDNCSSVIIQSNSLDAVAGGIILSQSEFSNISLNTLKNTNIAIQVANSFLGSEIRDNRIQNVQNGYGIHLQHCSYSDVYNNFIHGNGIQTLYGIYLSNNSSYCNIVHNAVYLDVKNLNSAAINLSGVATSVSVKNNLFANYGKGNALITSSIVPGYDIDYNDYWAAQNRLLLMGQTTVNDFQFYQLLSGYDAHSFNQNPFYTSSSDLVSNHTLLNNSGVYTSPYLHDIDSVMRANPPDMGAREFDICPVDAGINRFIGLEHSMTPGNHDIAVELQNHGQTTIANCLIHWSVNGVYQSGISWTGSLLPGQHFQVNLSSLLVITGKNYTLKAWTGAPNGVPDCNQYNDTGKFSPLTTPLCGTYTIGGTSPDFQSFAEANEILEYAGVTCPVLFLVRDGTYNEQLEFGPISGASTINTITFRGQNMDSTSVILDVGSSVFNYLLHFKSSAWFNWEYLTFRRSAYSAANCLWLEAFSHDIAFKSCQIQGYKGSNLTSTYTISFDKCYFSKVPGGIFMEMGIDLDGQQLANSSISVTNSEFFQLGSRVISLEACNLAVVTNNWIHDGTSGNESMYLSEIDSALICNNLIENQTEGLKLISCHNTLIADNTIRHLQSPAITIFSSCSTIQVFRNRISYIQNTNALYIYSGSNIQIYNNFIHVFGIQHQYGLYLISGLINSQIYHNSFSIESTGINSAAIYIGSPGQNTSIKNNILANFGGGPGLIVSSVNASFESDYNDYYSAGTYLIRHSGTDISQLSDWQTLTGLDPNSFAFNPFYISAEDLRPQQREINGAGVPSAAVPGDIDNQIRDENSPDIGADEFTIDFGILELMEPTLNCYLTSNDSIVVLVKQFGDIPLINIEIAYQVNNGLIFYDTIPGATTNDVIFTFSATQNLMSYGTYVFKIWLISQQDDNINNDTLIVTRHSSELPHITAGYLPACANSPTQFFCTGSLQVGAVDHFYWDFGDGQSIVTQDPLHVYDSSGTYHVHLYVFTQIGCYNDTVFDVQIFYTPNADYTASSICLGDTMTFDNMSSVSQGALSFTWDFGDGSTSQATDPTHGYSMGSIYGVELIAYAENGCSDTATQYYQVMPPPVLNFIGLPAAICNADPAFVVQVSPPGGNISGSGMFGNTFYPSLAGPGVANLSYEYTNSNGCSNMINSSLQVYGSPNIVLSAQTQVACKGNSTGSVTIAVNTGTSPSYSVLWNNGMSTNFISGLSAGIYSVTISDTNNCRDSAAYTVLEPVTALGLRIIKTDAICFETPTGTLFAQATGGNPPYPFYHWSNGSANQFIINLSAGTYTVSVMDVLGCTYSKTDTIMYPPQISLSFAVSDAVCPGESSGILTPTVTNTIAYPLSYLWSNGATTSILSGVPEGYYFLTVTDAHNCSFSDSSYISEPPPWQIYAFYDSALCFGSDDGAVYLMPTGSNPPFTDFLWENGVVDSFLTSVPAGFYSVTITDHLNCSYSDSFEVLQPDSLSLSFQVVDNPCYGDALGSIDLSAWGGTGSYPIIYWSSGVYTEDIGSLQAGVYTVTLSDSHHCSAISSVEVIQPDSIQLDLLVTPVNCFGESTGNIQASALGGTSPYLYEWSTGSNADNIINLETGSYSVTLQDQHGCAKQENIFVPTAVEIAVESEIINPTCMYSSDAVINLSTLGGFSPYTYSWSNGANFPTVENLAPGVYQLTVTDSTLCQRSFAVEIFRPTSLCIDPPLLFSPNGDGINDYWLLDGLEWTPLAVVTIFDRWGRVVYSSSGSYSPWDGRFKGEFVPSDAYFYVIDFSNGYPPVSGKLTVIY